MTVVVDASLVAWSLVDDGPAGDRAREAMAGTQLTAPAHLPVEVSSVLRRLVLRGGLGREVAAVAHADLAALPAVLFPFEAFALRIWELHATVTPYDAAYVALAEALDAPLVTADGRLARAPGPRCRFLVTPGP